MSWTDVPTLEILRVLLVNYRCQIAAVIQDHVEGLSTGKGCEGLFDAPVVFLVSFAFPGKHRNAGGGDATQTCLRKDRRNERQARLTLPQHGLEWKKYSKRHKHRCSPIAIYRRLHRRTTKLPLPTTSGSRSGPLFGSS